MRSNFLSSLCTAASQASRIKQLTCYHLPSSPIRRVSSYNRQGEEGNYSVGHGVLDAERAPSTAEEFKRVAEEKTRQGFASQTVEKAQDAAGEAAAGESTSGSVKEATVKESPGKGDLHNDE